jgi:hypothetical protein
VSDRYPENLEQIYPPKDTLGYPANLERIYPALRKAVGSASTASIDTPLVSPVGTNTSESNNLLASYSAREYPVFDLYPAVYPHNLEKIYPAFSRNPLISSTPAAKPAPPVRTHASAPTKSGSVPTPARQTQDVRMSRGYPFIDLYPAVYPHNLECLYTPVPKEVVAPKSVHDPVPESVHAESITSTLGEVETVLPPTRPALQLSFHVYPFNLDNLYPDVASARSESTPNAASAAPQTHETALKSFGTTSALKSHGATATGAGVRLARAYPNLELYAPVYPFNLDIYPPVGPVNALGAPKVINSGIENKVVGSSPREDGALGMF